MKEIAKWTTTLTIVSLVAAACSSQAPGTRPDDMSAADHHAAADKHEEMADEHREKYDPQGSSGRFSALEDGDTTDPMITYSPREYNPTAIHAEKAVKHEKIAREHRNAARSLEDFEEAQCSAFSPAVRSQCPLLGQVVSVEEIDSGARLTIHDGVPIGAVVDHMRCHFAFARSIGYEGMEMCPLYLKDIEIEEGAAEQTVTITSDDADTIAEIRKRSRAHTASKTK